MQPKTLYDFLFQLYDYADYVAAQIQPGANEIDNNNYFMTLVYIEEIMDSYGRGLISTSARKINPDDGQSLEEAHRRIDLLRRQMMKLSEQFNFNEALKYKTDKMLREWRSSKLD